MLMGNYVIYKLLMSSDHVRLRFSDHASKHPVSIMQLKANYVTLELKPLRDWKISLVFSSQKLSKV